MQPELLPVWVRRGCEVVGAVRFHEGVRSMLVPIESVEQHPQNPNNGDVDEIVTSILKNGMYRPIYVQRSTKFILAGNTTWAACLQLGAQEIPVVWLDVTDTDALRILTGDNEIAASARRDEAQLLEVLDMIIEDDGVEGLLGTGLQERDVDKLRQLVESRIDADELERAIEPKEKKPHGLVHKCPECGFVF
jgi:ParB-like chromosome segregation protein Spo0J